MKSTKSNLLSTVSLRTLAIAGAALASLMLLGACGSVGANESARAKPAASASPCNPCAAANPRNPCAAANPCAAQAVANGQFYDGPHAPGHRVSGSAHITKAVDGTYWLKFTQFVSDEGPDVNIILSPAYAPKTDAAIRQAGYITIAARQSLTGDQSYALPKDFEPELYQSVGIWCEQFGVLFGAAQL